MPLLKADKKALAKRYLQQVEEARNVVILKQEAIPVNAINKIRIALDEAQWSLQIVKKRVFLKGVQDSYEGASIDLLEGSIAILYSHNEEDQHAPLKVIHKYKKQWNKEEKSANFDYIGWRYDRDWKDSEYVSELASLPSKEELLSKLVYLLNHPVASLARALHAIGEQDEEPKEKPASDVSDDSESADQPTKTDSDESENNKETSEDAIDKSEEPKENEKE